MFEELFLRKKMQPQRLLAYGFVAENDGFRYCTEIMGGSFLLTVCINQLGRVDTALLEMDSREEYFLYRTDAEGVFVGTVRNAITAVLADIVKQCYVPSVFHQQQTLQLIDYVRATYNDVLEFLWKSSPCNAVWRRTDSRKWYGVLLTVLGRKVGLDSDARIEIVDLHIQPERMAELLRQKGICPGWHMNKKSWISIPLDGTVENHTLFTLVDDSYHLAAKQQKKTVQMLESNRGKRL